LGKETVTKVLMNSGLTEKESEVYLSLSKNGFQKAGDISRSLRMHKAQVYKILKKLQNRGLVEASLDFPMRFTAIPFEKFLDLLIKSKREEAHLLENRKQDYLTQWRSTNIDKLESPQKFVVLKGRSNIYPKILQMIEEADKEILVTINSTEAIKTVQLGFIDELRKMDIKIRYLTSVSKENVGIVKGILNQISTTNMNVEGRHIDLSCCRFLIKDDEEILLLLNSREVSDKERTALWTNSSEFVNSQKMFFWKLWHDAIEIDKRLREIETGKPAEEIARALSY